MRAAIKTGSELLLRFLPAIFWILLILGFDKPYIAVLTVCAALLHEIGHICAFLIIGERGTLGAHLSGFRIKYKKVLSYGEEILAALGGPLFNVIAFAVLLFVSDGGYVTEFAVINLLTALSNLLPIENHDGYRIFECALLSHAFGIYKVRAVASAVSFSLSAFFTIFSLYLILRGDTGYWIFIIFMVILVKKIKSDRTVFLRANERKNEHSRAFASFGRD